MRRLKAGCETFNALGRLAEAAEFGYGAKGLQVVEVEVDRHLLFSI